MIISSQRFVSDEIVATKLVGGAMNTQTLFTGHEADVAAIAAAPVMGEFVTVKIRLVGTGTSLAHPGLKPGRQPDGSIVLLADTFRRWEESRDAVTARVLMTTFLPRPANWVEAGFTPEWRVSGDDCRRPSVGFGAGQICDYWDGRNAQ